MPTKSSSRGSSSRSSSRSSSGSSTSGKRGSAKRTVMNTGTDKRYVRRDAKGRIKESDDVGRSLSSDRRKKAKTASKPGQGDRGDRKR